MYSSAGSTDSRACCAELRTHWKRFTRRASLWSCQPVACWHSRLPWPCNVFTSRLYMSIMGCLHSHWLQSLTWKFIAGPVHFASPAVISHAIAWSCQISFTFYGLWSPRYFQCGLVPFLSLPYKTDFRWVSTFWLPTSAVVKAVDDHMQHVEGWSRFMMLYMHQMRNRVFHFIHFI